MVKKIVLLLLVSVVLTSASNYKRSEVRSKMNYYFLLKRKTFYNYLENVAKKFVINYLSTTILIKFYRNATEKTESLLQSDGIAKEI
jgi:hypothetical protein